MAVSHPHWPGHSEALSVTWVPTTSSVDSEKQSMLGTEGPMGVAGQSKYRTIGWSEQGSDLDPLHSVP